MSGRPARALALALAGLLGPLGAAPAAALGTGTLSSGPEFELRLSPGGAVAQGQLALGREDVLTGVWSSLGRARLLRCSPRCMTVKELPFSGGLNLGQGAAYRIALGGSFRVGQRIALTLRFRSGQVLNLSARVAR